MLVRVVPETECDVVQVRKRRVVALGERDVVAGDELVEVYSIISGFALTIGGQDKNDKLVAWHRVEIVKIVVLQIGDHGLKAEAALALLGQPGGIILSGAGLRAVEDDAVFPRFLHLLDNVPRLPRLCAIRVGERVRIGILGHSPVLSLGEVSRRPQEDHGEDNDVQRVEFGHLRGRDVRLLLMGKFFFFLSFPHRC